jgi:nicotinate phosphoribosyltransferase
MQQAVVNNFPNTEVAYKFFCRTEGVTFTEKDYRDILEEFDYFLSLKFTDDELEYLQEVCPWMTLSYHNFLVNYTCEVQGFVAYLTSTGEFCIEYDGVWSNIILIEVPLLAIINEVYYRNHYNVPNKIDTVGTNNLDFMHKSLISNPLPIVDFGTRRRFSRVWHETVIRKLKDSILGTSNVLLSKRFNLKPIGTMAHEWIMAGIGLYSLKDHQEKMLEVWLREFDGELDTALTDTYGMKSFIQSCPKYMVKAFNGFRQDSGDPYRWVSLLRGLCNAYNIDYSQKTVVFSDGLSLQTAQELFDRYKNEFNVTFGIGTKLTNNFDPPPIQTVIKMIRCNGTPTVKLSDTKGKEMCINQDFLKGVTPILKEGSYGTWS